MTKYIAFTDTGYTPCGKWRVVPTEATDEMALNSVDGGFGYSLCVKSAPLPPAELLLSGEPATWRYQDARGNYRYRKYIPGFDAEYWILKPVALYLHPAPDSDTVRDAERYRALRESRNYSAGIGDKWGLRMTAAPLSDDERMKLDSAADAMIDAVDAARGAK